VLGKGAFGVVYLSRHPGLGVDRCSSGRVNRIR
jgi:hypothetical protein